MIDRLFVDTNILIYSLDPSVPEKRLSAGRLLLAAGRTGALVVSPQSLNECYRVLTDRLELMPRRDARMFVASLFSRCTAPLDAATTAQAFEIQDETRFNWWDCLLLASAIRANCRIFVSEDLDDGRVIEGMRIVNPFKHEIDDLRSPN